MECAIEVCPFVQILDAPVPQMGEQLPDILHFFSTFTPDLEQVIEVPKFLPDDVPMRTAVRVTQLVEQLVEVPTNPGYALAVVASKLGLRREIRGVLSGQGSTASGAALIVDTPVPQVRRGGGSGGLQVLVQGRIQLQRTWSRSLTIQLALEVFKVLAQHRVP